VCTYLFYIIYVLAIIADDECSKLAMNLAAVAAAVVLRFAYVGINKRRDRKDPAQIREKYSEEELLAMGDKSPLYRYVV
jgi:hypothetical protein